MEGRKRQSNVGGDNTGKRVHADEHNGKRKTDRWGICVGMHTCGDPWEPHARILCFFLMTYTRASKGTASHGSQRLMMCWATAYTNIYHMDLSALHFLFCDFDEGFAFWPDSCFDVVTQHEFYDSPQPIIVASNELCTLMCHLILLLIWLTVQTECRVRG